MPYLDHAAGSPLRPEARRALLEAYDAAHGNPAGAHRAARASRRVLDDAREVVAAAVGAHPTEVVFTSGGTEADNLAVLGALDATGGVAVCSAVEHHAVLDPVLARRAVAGDVDVTAGVGRDGVIDAADLAAVLDRLAAQQRPVAVVSVMALNNEVGTIQPVGALVEVVRRHAPGALVHCDAVAAAPWLDLADVTAGCDLVSISSHKVGGPPGVGALVGRDTALRRLAPRQLGGGQERGVRPGTQDVAGASAFAAALTATAQHRPVEVPRVSALRAHLLAGLRAAVSGLVATVLDGGAPVSPGSCHVCIPGVHSDELLFLLDRDGVAASAASACSSGAQLRSHVLAAMGVEPATASGALRLSLGWSTTDADVDAAVHATARAVDRLRPFAEVAP